MEALAAGQSILGEAIVEAKTAGTLSSELSQPAQCLYVALARLTLIEEPAHARDQASERMLRNNDWRSGTRNYRPSLVPRNARFASGRGLVHVRPISCSRVL
jgi:hypothetical protein